jgi:hypothetical protein
MSDQDAIDVAYRALKASNPDDIDFQLRLGMARSMLLNPELNSQADIEAQPTEVRAPAGISHSYNTHNTYNYYQSAQQQQPQSALTGFVFCYIIGMVLTGVVGLVSLMI